MRGMGIKSVDLKLLTNIWKHKESQKEIEETSKRNDVVVEKI